MTRLLASPEYPIIQETFVPTPLKTLAASIVLALSLGSLAACSDDSSDGSASDQKTSESGAAGSKADLTGIPATVAVVNGTEITKADFVTAYESQFQQATVQAQASGQPVDQDALKKETADGLANNELLLQEGERRSFTSSDADVDKALEDYAKQSGAGTSKAYLEALAGQGLDEDEVRSQLADQVVLDQLLADEVGDAKPSNKELRTIYDQAVAQQEQAGAAGQQAQEVPPFDEVKDQLVEQATTQKKNEAAQGMIETLRKKAKITISL